MSKAHPSDRPTMPPAFDLDDYARRTCGFAIPGGSASSESDSQTCATPAEVPVIQASGRVTLEVLHLLMFVDGSSSLSRIAERSRVDLGQVCQAFTELARVGIVALQAVEKPAPQDNRRSGKRRARIDTKMARACQRVDAPNLPIAVNED